MTATARIRWEELLGGNFEGYVGSVTAPMFEVHRTSGRGAIQPWALRSDLLEGYSTGTHPDEMKDEAERWLAGFVSSLGVVFPDESPMVCTACRRPVRKVPGIWAPSVWEHAETEDGRACPDLGAHLTGVPIMAMVAPGPETSTPRAGEKEADR